MAAQQITRRALQAALRTARPIASQPILRRSILDTVQRPSSITHAPTSSIRFHSSSAPNNTVYDFSQIQSLTATPSETQVLIDVREPAEYEAGYIPTAINIPISSNPDAMMLPEEEFEDRFGFEKPSQDKEVVFYCKAGVRSSAAAQLARQGGYEKVGEYRGSWLDWNKNQGKVSR